METSTQSKHTPGPWEIRNDMGPSLYIAERGKMPHANVFGRADQSIDAKMLTARLISASPDLLAACERFIDELGDKFAHIDGECTCSTAGSDPDCRRHGAVDFMRAAISKARFG